MLESAFVVLREAVELLLIVAAALKYARHIGRPLGRSIYIGTFAGMSAAVIALLVMVEKPLSELAEAGLSIGLGLMVLSFAISMLSSSPDIERHVRDRLQDFLEGKAGPLLIAGFCAVAGFREIMETGIFVRSIVTEIGVHDAAEGVLLGSVMVGVTCVAYRSLSSRLSLLAVYRISTLLLCLISIQLLVDGAGKLLRLGNVERAQSFEGLLIALTPGTSAYGYLCASLMIIPIILVGRRWWRTSSARAR